MILLVIVPTTMPETICITVFSVAAFGVIIGLFLAVKSPPGIRDREHLIILHSGILAMLIGGIMIQLPCPTMECIGWVPGIVGGLLVCGVGYRFSYRISWITKFAVMVPFTLSFCLFYSRLECWSLYRVGHFP